MDAVHIILGAPKLEEVMPLIQSEGIVIGVDRGALIAIEEGIPLDIAIGDFDSISKEEKALVHTKANKVMNFPTDKDDTDTELAFLYVMNNYSNAKVFLYNWYGGRVDHLYSILLVALQNRFKALVPNLHYISDKNNISYFSPGTYRIEKIERMEYLSYVLLTPVEKLTLKEVKYTLEEVSFDHPMSLISNEFIGVEATFSFATGIVAVIQSND